MIPISEDANGRCKGDPDDYPLSDVDGGGIWCWEQVLCKKYFWGNVKGKWSSVYKGMPVYFVYTALDNTLTLWGHSSIKNINNDPGLDYPYIEFEPFKPLAEEKAVKGLTGEMITGKHWRQLNFRYLDEKHEAYLASLIKGGNIHNITPQEHDDTITIELRRDIKEKLEEIAEFEDRDIRDLIREAIAKLIRERN